MQNRRDVEQNKFELKSEGGHGIYIKNKPKVYTIYNSVTVLIPHKHKCMQNLNVCVLGKKYK